MPAMTADATKPAGVTVAVSQNANAPKAAPAPAKAVPEKKWKEVRTFFMLWRFLRAGLPGSPVETDRRFSKRACDGLARSDDLYPALSRPPAPVQLILCIWKTVFARGEPAGNTSFVLRSRHQSDQCLGLAAPLRNDQPYARSRTRLSCFSSLLGLRGMRGGV
jgi:hypothetical protein